MPQITLQPGTIAWIIAAGALVAVLHSLLSYTRARNAAGARWARVMSLLRFVAIALLVLAAFQPTLSMRDRSSRARPVVIILDDSRSMGVIDSTRDVSELLRFAESTGQLATEKRDRPTRRLLIDARKLPPLIDELRVRREAMNQAKTAGQVDENIAKRVGEQTDLVAQAIASMRVMAQQDPATSFVEPRLKHMESVLPDPAKFAPLQNAADQTIIELVRREEQLDEQLSRSDPEVAALVTSLRQKSRLDFAKAALKQLGEQVIDDAKLQRMEESIRPDVIDALSADRAQTPLLATLLHTIERVNPRDVEAVVLFTDGRSTEPRHAVPPLLSAAGVRVYPVLVAPEARQPDVRITRIEAPATALAGEKLAVSVHIRSRGAEGKVTKINVSDGKNKQTRSIGLGAEDVVHFDLPAASTPRVTIEAAIDPLPGEVVTDNNAAKAEVAVVEQKLKVMLIAGTLGWDAQYLRNVLSRTTWVSLEEQTLQPNESCRFKPDEIAKQDIFILAGAGASALSTQQVDAISRAVSDQGKSVLLVDAEPDVLASYARQPLLATLLPFRVDQQPSWRQTPADEPTILAVPAPASAMIPLLRLDETPEASLQKWLARPRLYRSLDVGQLKPQAAALLVDRQTQAPLLIEHAVGAGRSALLATNELWRWRRDLGADVHDRFWLQLVRHLLEPPYDVSHGDMSLGVDRRNPLAGQTIDLRAKLPAGATAPVLQLRRGEQVLETQPLTQSVPGSGRWAARVTPASAGDAEVVLRSANEELSLPITVLPADEAELADVASDPALLTRIASATGGQMLTLDRVGELPALLRPRAEERVGMIEHAIWCSPYLFGLIVACLGLEWAIRKQKGLV